MTKKEKIEEMIAGAIVESLTVEEAAERILALFNVSQQRELLNALADDFNESTDTYVGQARIERVLKAFNCV